MKIPPSISLIAALLLLGALPAQAQVFYGTICPNGKYAISESGCLTDEEKAQKSREAEAQDQKNAREQAALKRAVDADVAKYGEHRRKEFEQLAAMRAAAQRAAAGMNTLGERKEAGPATDATSPMRGPHSADTDHKQASQPPVPRRDVPDKPEENCSTKPVIKSSMGWGDSEAAARQIVERGNPGSSCPEGRSGSDNIVCTSKTEAAPDLDKSCATSLKLCPRRVVYRCTRTVRCAVEQKVCKPTKGDASRQ